MRLLAFGDTHGDARALSHVMSQSAQADLLVCCGDLTLFERGLLSQLAALAELEKPVLIVPGNHEGRGFRQAVSRFSNVFCLDGDFYDAGQILVLGAPGNGFSRSDPGFAAHARLFAKILHDSTKGFVLATHAPPFGTDLDLIGSSHCGSRPIRDFILEAGPKFALSGHLHENSGKSCMLGATLVINPGPMGVILDI